MLLLFTKMIIPWFLEYQKKQQTVKLYLLSEGVPQGLVLGPLPVTPYYKTLHQLVQFLPAISKTTVFL